MANELTAFDYGQLDGDTAAFLEGKASNIRSIVQNAYTDVGRELKEAQGKLLGQAI